MATEPTPPTPPTPLTAEQLAEIKAESERAENTPPSESKLRELRRALCWYHYGELLLSTVTALTAQLEEAQGHVAAINHVFSDAPDAVSALVTNLMRRWNDGQLNSLALWLRTRTEHGRGLDAQLEEARCQRDKLKRTLERQAAAHERMGDALRSLSELKGEDGGNEAEEAAYHEGAARELRVDLADATQENHGHQ